jgi:hypothetical protein
MWWIGRTGRASHHRDDREDAGSDTGPRFPRRRGLVAPALQTQRAWELMEADES